jgi:hypothetical protein
LNREESTADYQELKFTVHKTLLDRINLEALSSMADDRVRAQVRTSVAQLVEAEKSPLSLVVKDRIIEQVLDEVFGLGPLEPLLQDRAMSDILVTTPHLVYGERAGKLYRTPVEVQRRRTCSVSLKRSCLGSAAALTNRLRWWMPAFPTDRA